MRRTPGLEASIIDNDRVEIGAMGDSGDGSPDVVSASVAALAADLLEASAPR